MVTKCHIPSGSFSDSSPVVVAEGWLEWQPGEAFSMLLWVGLLFIDYNNFGFLFLKWDHRPYCKTWRALVIKYCFLHLRGSGVWLWKNEDTVQLTDKGTTGMGLSREKPLGLRWVRVRESQETWLPGQCEDEVTADHIWCWGNLVQEAKVEMSQPKFRSLLKWEAQGPSEN